MGMFFEEANPPNLKVSGDVSLSTDSSIGGDNSRLLRGALEVIPLEPFDTKKSSGDETPRVLVVSDETGSFDIDVALAESSKMSSTTASKASKTAVTTGASSIISDVILGGIVSLLVLL